MDAPWYVTNETIYCDLKIPTVKEKIFKFSNRYIIRINDHHNPLVTKLLETMDEIRRLKRHYCSIVDERRKRYRVNHKQ